MRQFLWTLLVVTWSVPLPSAAESVRVLGRVILGETRMDGEKIGEFSALVRDPDGTGVLAISDRGYLARLDIGLVDGQLRRVTPVSVFVLKAADGSAMRDQNFNPEGAAMLDDGTLAIVSEDGPRLAVFDLQGNWLRDEHLPVAVADATHQANEKDGLESLAWTRARGFMSMTEEPQTGNSRDKHTIYSVLQDPVSFSSAGSDFVSIKGMETVGNHLILLERSRDDVTRAIQPWLRFVDLDACTADMICRTRQLPIQLDGLPDADFEGLVALDDHTFLAVSDDKIDGDLRSVFVLLNVAD
jgi:hypothetical protein